MATIRRDDTEHLPQSAEAEQAVLGSLLIDPDAILSVREVGLDADDFLAERHRVVYAAMLELADRWQPVELLTVAAMLEERRNGKGSQLEAIGGSAYLTDLVTSTPTSVHAVHYASIVKACAQRRRVIAAAASIASAAQGHDGPIDELYSMASGLLFGAIETVADGSHLYGTDDTLMAYLETQERRAERMATDPNTLITTGLADLDRMIGNLEPATLTAIAGRPGVGKTILMEQLAEHNAKHGKRVVFYHLEFTHQFMLDRRMARYASVSLYDLRRGDRAGKDAVARACDALREWHHNLLYVDCPGWSAERIAADIARLAARGECDLAIVDYLQLIPLPDNRRGLNASMLIGAQAGVLKTAANQLQIPLVLGSQLRRGERSLADKTPTLDDFRNSGEIEEKVNLAMLLHRPEPRPEGAPTERIECHVAKNTSGELGTCNLVHLCGKFMFGPEARETVDDDPYWDR